MFDRKVYMKEYGRKRYLEHRDREVARVKEYAKEHPEVSRKAGAKYYWKNREKRLERAKISSLARYYVPLAKLCELCPDGDKRAASERHHPDYNYPLIIVPTCRECHDWIEKGVN